MVLFPCWSLPSLPLLVLDAVVTAVVVEAAESVLSSEQTRAKYIFMKLFFGLDSVSYKWSLRCDLDVNYV